MRAVDSMKVTTIIFQMLRHYAGDFTVLCLPVTACSYQFEITWVVLTTQGTPTYPRTKHKLYWIRIAFPVFLLS